MKKLLFSAMMLLTGTSVMGVSAQAADVSAPAIYDWSGPYVGLSVGAAFVDSTVSDDTPLTGFFDNNNGEDSITASETALQGGLNFGYNLQMDQVVLGVESELGLNTFDDTELSLADGGDGDSHHAEYGFYGQLSGRIGIAADRLLPYIKGGLAVVDAEYVGGDIDPGPVFDPNFSYSKSKTRFGYLVGAGVEYAWSDNLSIKLEYNYVDLGTISVSDNGGRSYDIDDDAHIAKLGVNFGF